MRFCLLAVIALPCAFAIRCYDYIDKNDDLDPLKTWLDCDSQYCFKRYIEYQERWLASRDCGSSNLCKSEGCTGTRDNSRCCRGELCNT